MLVAQGGGCDGGAIVADTNRSVRLHRWLEAVAELQRHTASSSRHFGKVEQAGEGESE